jgi:LuxR family transcriptional regulator
MDTLDLDPAYQCSRHTLTHREIETLKWSAVGKTAADIAMILRIKERTVHFHIASAVQKLGVPNKTAAVVQAISEGMF